MYRNYIFDLYGTLVDIKTNEKKAYLWKKMAMFYSLNGALYSWDELKRGYEAAIAEEYEEENGGYDPFYEIEIRNVFKKLYVKKGIESSDELTEATAVLFRTISHERIKLFCDVTGMLDGLKAKGKKVYLLSNAQEAFTMPEIKYLGLYDKFDGILISSNERVKKPSPEYFKRLFDRYGLDPKESVYIGNDYHDDIKGALGFGIDAVFVNNYIYPDSGNRYKDILKCVSVDTMRKSDSWTISNLSDSKSLMYRAGAGIYESSSWNGPVGIVCGKGNNAGDGFVVADLLKQNGISCEIILLTDEFSADGKYYYDRAVAGGVKTVKYESGTKFDKYESILDCIFGTGFKGEPAGSYKEAIEEINKSGAYVVSADINSGLNGDTGQGSCYVVSDLTVSIGSYKTGHFAGKAKEAIKNRVNIDIGIVII